MVEALGRPEGGFTAKCYGDPGAVGHSQDAITAMCDEFLAISREIQQKYQENNKCMSFYGK
jgi:hypothetical protein